MITAKFTLVEISQDYVVEYRVKYLDLRDIILFILFRIK